MRAWMTMGVLAALASACASNPAPVPLSADPEGKRLLTGDWSGQYVSRETGRTGSIVFSLVEHCPCGELEEHAHGDVLMIPRDREALRPVEGSDPVGASAPESRILRIEFMRATGDHMTGRIEPYHDPETGHPISTTFEGTVQGDTIAGEFISIDARTGDRYVGTWEVTRRKPKT